MSNVKTAHAIKLLGFHLGHAEGRLKMLQSLNKVSRSNLDLVLIHEFFFNIPKNMRCRIFNFSPIETTEDRDEPIKAKSPTTGIYIRF